MMSHCFRNPFFPFLGNSVCMGILLIFTMAITSVGCGGKGTKPPPPAPTNPFFAKYPVFFRLNNQNLRLEDFEQRPNTPQASGGQWIPGLKPWNNRNTSKGNPVWNNDSTGLKFSAPVTPALVDAFWDWYYITQTHDTYVNTWKLPAGTFKRISGSGFDQNCYGYAASTLIGAGYAYFMPRDTPEDVPIPGIQASPNGLMLILRDDGWGKEPGATHCKKDCMLLFTAAPLSDHVIVMKDCCADGCAKGVDSIKRTIEKNGTGGVYEGTWNCPPGIDLSPKGEIWCKKN